MVTDIPVNQIYERNMRNKQQEIVKRRLALGLDPKAPQPSKYRDDAIFR